MTQKKAFIYTTIIFGLLTLFSYLANAQPTGKISGVWLRDDKNLIIEIYKAGPQYFGKQIWGNSLYEDDGATPKKDENNVNETLRRRDLINLTVLTNFNYEGRVYDGGTFYNFESGKKYKSILRLKGENILKIRGYSVLSTFGKTTPWTRVQ
jgi:uncharacterized protein (DUF2147 family)